MSAHLANHKKPSSKPYWLMTRAEYFKERTRPQVKGGYRSYSVAWLGSRLMSWQQAQDHIAYDKVFGHLYIIQQTIKERGVGILTAENYIEYEAPLRRFISDLQGNTGELGELS